MKVLAGSTLFQSETPDLVSNIVQDDPDRTLALQLLSRCPDTTGAHPRFRLFNLFAGPWVPELDAESFETLVRAWRGAHYVGIHAFAIEMAALQKLLLANDALVVHIQGDVPEMLACKDLWSAPVTCLADIEGAVAPEASIGSVLTQRWNGMKAVAAASLDPNDFVHCTGCIAASIPTDVLTGRRSPVTGDEMFNAAMFGFEPAILAMENEAARVACGAARGNHVNLLGRALAAIPDGEQATFAALENAVAAASFEAVDLLQVVHTVQNESSTKLSPDPVAELAAVLMIENDVSERVQQLEKIIQLGFRFRMLYLENMVATADLLTHSGRWDALFLLLRRYPTWVYDASYTAFRFAQADDALFRRKDEAIKFMLDKNPVLKRNSLMRNVILDQPTVERLELAHSMAFEWSAADWLNAKFRSEHLDWLREHGCAWPIGMPTLCAWAGAEERTSSNAYALEWALSLRPLPCAIDWSALEAALAGNAQTKTRATFALNYLKQIAGAADAPGVSASVAAGACRGAAEEAEAAGGAGAGRNVRQRLE